MDEEPENGVELFMQDGIIAKSSILESKNVDIFNTLGILSVTEYKSDLGKCIEWTQCDVSIESDDQEWAIVRDSKFHVGSLNDNSKNSKTPIIQIPLKNLLSFKVSKNNSQLTLQERERPDPVIFYFQHGQKVKHFIEFLKKTLNTSVSKKDLNLYIVRDQKEVQILEKSFAELDLFSDDSTRSDAVWSFIKKLHENPYETTLSAFSKVTDAFLYKPQPREIDDVADLLNRSLTSEELPDFQDRNCSEDYELISKSPPLPPRTLPPRSSSLSPDHWALFFDEEGRISEEEMVKEVIFHGGVSPVEGLRSEVWKFLLGYYPWNSTFTERETIRRKKKEEYIAMKFQWKSMTPTQEDNFAAYKERKSLIEKDVYRTDRNIPFFAGDNNPNLEILQNILMTYVMYNFDLGYVQGMSDLLSPLLLQLRDEVETFWCFVGFMNKVYRNFDMDQAGMKEQLHQLYCLLCCIEPELASYLQHQDSNNMSFCFRWLLIWFKREFTFENIFILWEVLWTGALCKNFHLLICAAILDTEKEKLMSNNYGFTEILKHVNELVNNINLDLVLKKAEGIYIQLFNAAKIPNTVREIIGLNPLPESDTNEEEGSSGGGGDDKGNGTTGTVGNKCTKQNGISCESAPYSSLDPNEFTFDTSISLQYL